MRPTDHEDGLLPTPYGTVRYVDNHGDGPTLLFCHGNSGMLDGFAAVTSLLNADHRVVAFDFIGFGGSSGATGPTSTFSIRGQAQVLRSVVELLGLSDYVIVGHSLGGHVALEALPHLGGAVASVCLAAPPIGPGSLNEAFQSDPTGGLIFQDVLNDQEIATLASYLAPPALVGEGNYAAAVVAVGLAQPGARSALGRSIAALDFSDEVAVLERWGKPSSFLQGTDDPFVDVGYFGVDQLQRQPGFTVTLLDRCGHSPHLSRPEAVVATIAEVSDRTARAVHR